MRVETPIRSIVPFKRAQISLTSCDMATVLFNSITHTKMKKKKQDIVPFTFINWFVCGLLLKMPVEKNNAKYKFVCVVRQKRTETLMLDVYRFFFVKLPSGSQMQESHLSSQPCLTPHLRLPAMLVRI